MLKTVEFPQVQFLGKAVDVLVIMQRWVSAVLGCASDQYINSGFGGVGGCERPFLAV